MAEAALADQPGSEHAASAAAAMAPRFAEAWARPSVDRLVALLDEDVLLLQPVTPPLRGREAARKDFARLLAWLPDIRGEIDSCAVTGDTLLVVWRLLFTLGGNPFVLPIVDRIVVRGDRIVEREAYFDSLRFFLATLGRPSAWAGYLRYRGYLPSGVR